MCFEQLTTIRLAYKRFPHVQVLYIVYYHHFRLTHATDIHRFVVLWRCPEFTFVFLISER